MLARRYLCAWIGSNRTCLQGEIAEHQRKIHVPFKIFMQVPKNSLSFVRFCCFTGFVPRASSLERFEQEYSSKLKGKDTKRSEKGSTIYAWVM
ncbi:unnamed protein product [Urochloa humidicola]